MINLYMVKLTKKDIKILRELEFNARLPLSQLSKIVQINRLSLGYRIKRLESLGMILGYNAIIDYMALGYYYYRLLLQFENTTEEEEKKIIDYGKQTSIVGWIASLEGNWNLVFVVFSKDPIIFKGFYDEVMVRFGEYISEKKVTIATKIYSFNAKFLFGAGSTRQVILGDRIVHYSLDELDIKILNMLSRNARSTLIEMGQELKLSANAVNYRISGLIQKGIIKGFRTNINFSKLDYYHYKVFIELKNHSKEFKADIITWLKHAKEVIYVTEAIGSADLEFEAECRNSKEVYELIKKIRNKFPDNIKNYEVILTYYEHRINYLPIES